MLREIPVYFCLMEPHLILPEDAFSAQSGGRGGVRSRTGLALLLGLVLVAGGFAWSWRFASGQYRDELLQAIRIARAGNNPQRVQQLSATTADYTDPDYLWLKRELIKAKEAVPKCRWLYIMRMGEDGRIFSVCDSDPDFPVDHTLPGFIYEDTSGGFTEILLHGTEKVWGPYTDAFGRWVTAAVPIRDDQSGEIVAVLGMDVEYPDWVKGVLWRALPPMAFTLLIALLIGSGLVLMDLRRQRDRQVRAAVAGARQLQRLQALNALSGSESLRRGDMEAFCRELTETAARALEVERVGIWLFNDDRTELRNVDTFILSRGTHESGETMDGAAFYQEWKTLEQDRYFNAPDVMNDPRSQGYRDYLAQHGIVSLLDTAILLQGGLRGAVCFEHTGELRTWSEGEIGFASQVADQVALALTYQREREEQRRREVLTSAMEQAEEPIMITDAAAKLIYVNAAFERVTGYSREEVLGRTPAILKSGHQSAAFYEDLWRILQAGQSWTGRMVNRRKDGTLFIVQETIAPVRDEQGRTTHYVSTILDITESVKEAERLQEARKMEAVGRLAGGVAHDFNNMLNVIIGHADMALEELPEGMPAQQDLLEIQRAALRAAALTRQLLDFARRRPVQPRPLDLREAVPAMLDMLIRLVGEEITLRWEPMDGDLTVMLDPSHLDQILINLVANARDAIGGRPGNITIRAGSMLTCRDGAGMDGGDLQWEQCVALAVADDGRGMPESVRQRIFEPFYTTKGIGYGTGLGLATVRSIVQGAGGFIEVDSAPGCGTVFVLYFPACHAPSAPVKQEEPPRTRLARRKAAGTALVVEDEEAILRLARVLLERHGFTVITAPHPLDAVARLEELEGLDLLVTDVIMPGMNGRELADRVTARFPGARCLFMSGYTDDIIGRHGVLEPGVHFLQKPFTMRVLQEAVWRVMGWSEAEET